MSSKDPLSEQELPRYQSLTDLKAAHSGLLKAYKDDQSEALLDEIERFVRSAAGTGAVLDNDNDRYGVQSLIDYWVTILYRGKRTPPDATLVEFDPALSPKLDDSLCPYRGLNAFQEDDKDLFFGRQRLLEVLLKKTTTTRLLFVVGPSGSGKSSLVLAGLVPALKSGMIPGSKQWRYIPSLTPGQNPLKHLASALATSYEQSSDWVLQTVEQMQADPGHLAKLVESFGSDPAVVVIDQFEEVFTLCNDDAARDAFVANLLSLTSSEIRHEVIVTLRTDYESYLAYNAALMSSFEEGQVRVMPLSAAELRSAIEEPAKRVDLRFEEGVVDGLVKDILGEPEGLPLLQFTLLRLWKSRENGRNRITLRDYRKLGGARRALALTADEFYESLTDAKRITLERIMLRLALPTGTEEIVRNTVKRETLYFEDPRRVDDVLDGLAEKGLIKVTKGDDLKNDKIEVAHEALIRHWPTLVGWIEKQRVTMRQRLRLTSAAQQWLEHGRDEGGLLGGSLLAEALQYSALNDLEKEFVDASQAAQEREERRREQEQRKKARRQRQFVSVLTALLIVTLVAAGLAFWQGVKASEKATLAQSNYEEALKQTGIADQQRQEAQRQELIARNSIAEMENALGKATKAEALAKQESARAKTETRRAIAARNDANRYNRLYLEELAKQDKELALRKQRDEAYANMKREQPEKAIELYTPLVYRYKEANDFSGQAEALSQLSTAYERLAERAQRKRNKEVAERNHAEAVAKYDAALKVYDEELKKETGSAGNNKEGVLSILWEKAQFFKDHNKIAEAEKTYLEALAIQEETLTGIDLREEDDYDNLKENLIDLYLNRQQPPQKQKLALLYNQVLQTKKRLHPGAESRDVYLLLREIANFYRGEKNFAEAQARYREALLMVQEAIKKDQTENELARVDDLVESLTDVARTYSDLKDNKKAEDYYRQAIQKQEKKVALLNYGQSVLAELKISLAQTLAAQQKYTEALTYYDDALKSTYADQTDTNVSFLTNNLEAIADILQTQGKLDEIQQRYQETLDAFKDNQTVKAGLAKSLINQARSEYKAAPEKPPEEALRYFTTAEKLVTLAYSVSPTVENTATSSFNQAVNALLDKRFNQSDTGAETEHLFTQLLDLKEQSIEAASKEPARVAESVIAARNADSVVAALERMYSGDEKLSALYSRALIIRKIAYRGTDNPVVYRTYNELGRLSVRLGQYKEAKANYTEALAIVDRVFKGNNNAELVVDSLLTLANVYVITKEYAEAEKFYLRAISNLEKSTKAKSEKMAGVLEDYADILKASGRVSEANKRLQDALLIRSKLTSSAKP